MRRPSLGRRSTSADDQYWRDYDGLQAVKHGILARYLDGWFPILSTFGGQLLYLDCHAGRGRHETGDPGSPILVLDGLLRHRLQRQILSRVEVSCHFFEISEDNAKRLNQEIVSLGPLPPRISVGVHTTDYEASLSQILEQLGSADAELPPSFAFIDPYGFKLSMRLMNRLLRAGRVEVLINFMYRYVDMALPRPEMAGILDELFGTSEWRRLRSLGDQERRFAATVKLFADQLSAEHVSWIVMRGASGKVKYVLLHGTNDLAGRLVMKEAIWAALPDGRFTAYERDRPEQGLLISADTIPTQRILDLLRERFLGRSVELFDDIYAAVDASPYRRVHVHEVLDRAVKRGVVQNLDEPGKFVINRNPRLKFSDTLPDSLAVGGADKQQELFS